MPRLDQNGAQRVSSRFLHRRHHRSVFQCYDDRLLRIIWKFGIKVEIVGVVHRRIENLCFANDCSLWGFMCIGGLGTTINIASMLVVTLYSVLCAISSQNFVNV